jgi:hypothetical protein
MASIRKRNGSWVADIRRKGHKSVSKSFPTKSLAAEWTRKIEREMDSSDYRDGRSLNSITFDELIDRYKREIGAIKPFGRNKAAVLESLKRDLGLVPLGELNGERLNKYCAMRRKDGAGGVTIGIELTYIGAVLKVASAIWKLPVNLQAVTDARTHLSYIGVSMKSKERNRRPTTDEIERFALTLRPRENGRLCRCQTLSNSP